MREDAIVFAGLMPHAPILVPGVGSGRAVACRHTAAAMTEVAQHAVAARPDTVLLVSPHSPRRPGAFGVWHTARLRGSLAHFGAAAARVDLPLDREFARRLQEELEGRGGHAWHITGDDLDHGATVPLVFLNAAGWNGHTVVVGLNYPGEGQLDELGQAIAATGRSLRRRLAVIASGDMSHCLTPSAPNGFHPDGGRFDRAFIELLRRDAPLEIPRLDPVMQDNAAEDVVDSTRVAFAATGGATDGHAVLSYEGPFGVGYGVAILFESSAAADSDVPVLAHAEELPHLARCAVEARFAGQPDTPPCRAAGELAERHGVFVTLHADDGELRGCRGSPVASQENLVWETWRSATAAAFDDHRFEPVRAEELPRLRFSVTILGPMEDDASVWDLNPAVYGVMVSALDGRRALLLPDIEGIETVEQQLAIVRRKAGIGPDEAVSLRRFTARRFDEPPRAAGG